MVAVVWVVPAQVDLLVSSSSSKTRRRGRLI
jgi:hypothetical protein